MQLQNLILLSRKKSIDFSGSRLHTMYGQRIFGRGNKVLAQDFWVQSTVNCLDWFGLLGIYIISILDLMPCYSPTSLSKLKENFKNLAQVNINFDPLPSLLYDFHPVAEIEMVTNLIRLATITYFDKETNRRLIQRNRSVNFYGASGLYTLYNIGFIQARNDESLW